MIHRPRRELRTGQFIRVVDRRGEFVAWGIFSPNGSLAVRVLSECESDRPGPEFFYNRLKSAMDFRETILSPQIQSDAYRVVHGEADGLSGLIVDKYADVIVIEPYSAGYIRSADWIISALTELYPGCRVAFRPDATTVEREGVAAESAELVRKHGPPASVTIRERSIKMNVDFRSGHKTGYFLDQRNNRAAISGMSAGKNILDLFCYTGGFSISAAAAGAATVTAVDLDENALRTAKSNAHLNGVRPEFIHADVFDFLRERVKTGRTADIVILDPAKLAGVRDEIPRAKRTYDDLNRLAMKTVAPGGVLLTCSCSGFISEPEFLSILSYAAMEAGVVLQIFRIAGASPDHPVSSAFPEGRYLKAVFARVTTGSGRPILAEEVINPKPRRLTGEAS